MESTAIVMNCVEFKNELHKKLYKASGANNFNEYIKYINSIYSDNRDYFKNQQLSAGAPTAPGAVLHQ